KYFDQLNWGNESRISRLGGDSTNGKCTELGAEFKVGEASRLEPMVQSFEPMVQGFEPMVQGFEPMVQGFETMVQGFEPMVQGFETMVQGFLPPTKLLSSELGVRKNT
uniref:Uncharacterized protein n=1 Tax=Callorhinchus milii TaxID=7868 RepID=A0A4W3JFQ0_CALMI